MSGAATLLLLLCCQVFAYVTVHSCVLEEQSCSVKHGRRDRAGARSSDESGDEIKPPQELSIPVPTPGHVKINTPEKTEEIKIFHTHTIRSMVALHRGPTAQVATQVYEPEDYGFPEDSELSSWETEDLSQYPGVEGTSATDLSCQIYIEASERCSLSCNWAPGGKAPPDTMYDLYYRYGGVTEQCQDYKTEAGGQRRTGCHILSSVISIKNSRKILVHINGTSNNQQIKAMEKTFTSSDIEIIPPIRNLTMNENRLQWIKPLDSLTDRCFHYQINIWSHDRNETITVGHTSYLTDALQKPATRQSVRLRAVGKTPCWFHETYSSWTDFIHIGEDTDRGDKLIIIVSVCLIVACIIIFFLFIRFWGDLFPQIPTPKNDLKETFQTLQGQALMRCNSWDNEEVISYIEELVEPEKYKTSLEYARIGDYSSSGLCKPL
ncbi:interleukin-5 receptor subunit alpha isoform X2 [Rhinoderma darwinii]